MRNSELKMQRFVRQNTSDPLNIYKINLLSLQKSPDQPAVQEHSPIEMDRHNIIIIWKK